MLTRGIRRRRMSLLAAPLLAAAVAVMPGAAPPAAAAGDSLSLTTRTTYTVVPVKAVVHVVVDVAARNDKPDLVSGGVRTRYFYDGFRLGIQPEARSIRASSGGRNLALKSSAGNGYSLIDVRFLRSLFHGQSEAVRISFDLPGGKPRSKSAIRVDPAFVTFEAWAFGDSGSVRVVVPAAFDTTTSGSDLTRSVSGGNAVYAASGITDVPAWYAVINADRPTALTNTRVDLPGGEHLVVRAWPDDPTWSKEVTALLREGLPELERQTGLDWPVSDDLGVFEVHTPLLEGYAGVFFENENRIEISEDLDDLTILHEASHAWFNGTLFDGRWINEGFADAFASRSLDALGLGGIAPGDVSPTDRAAVKLNEWTFPGRIADDETDAREQFGYDASWTVVGSLVDDVGAVGMRDVLGAAERGDIAYVDGGVPEHVAGPTDWRRLLDLVDEVGHARSADDLFRRWVVADADATVLDTRAAARAAYARLADEARDWAIPLAIRQPMSDWSFASVGGLVTSAETVLRQRDAIAGFAGGLGIAPPTDLRSAFEHAASSFDEAIGIGAAELRGVQTVEAAADAVAAPRAPLVSLGLLGTDPEARLGAVLAAFSAGLPSAAADAAALRQTIVDAADVGRERLLDGIGVAVIVVLLLVLASGLLWRRRRARLAVQPVEGPSIVPAVAVEPAAMAVEPPAMAVESTTAEPVGVAPTAVETTAPEAIGLDPTAGRTMADTASATLADQSAGPVTGAVEPPSDRGETS